MNTTPHRRWIVAALVFGLVSLMVVLGWLGFPDSPSMEVPVAGETKSIQGDGSALAAELSSPRLESSGKAPRSTVDRDQLGIFVDPPTRVAASAPLILGLHGRGDTAAAFASLGDKLSVKLRFRSMQGSLPWQGGWAWFPSTPRVEDTDALKAAIRHIDAQVQAQGDRPVGAVGFSQGCMTLLHYLVKHPARLKAVVCVGGAVVGDLSMPTDTPHTPILFVHGSADAIVPLAAAKIAIQAMENRGFSTEFIEHAGGHLIPDGELSRVGGWLESKLVLDQPGSLRRD